MGNLRKRKLGVYWYADGSVGGNIQTKSRSEKYTWKSIYFIDGEGKGGEAGRLPLSLDNSIAKLARSL